MTTATEQAASQPSSPANAASETPPAAGTPTEGNLDSLLDEYSSKPRAPEAPRTEQQPAPSAPEARPEVPPQPALSAEDRQLLDEFKRDREVRSREKTDKDIGDAVKAVKGADETLGKLSDRAVRGLLHDLAASDERFREAFMRRDEDPKAWQRVLKAAAPELAKEFEGVQSTKISDDRASVLAAGRTTREAPPAKQVTNAELSRMSNSQFKRFKAEEASRVGRR